MQPNLGSCSAFTQAIAVSSLLGFPPSLLQRRAAPTATLTRRALARLLAPTCPTQPEAVLSLVNLVSQAPRQPFVPIPAGLFWGFSSNYRLCAWLPPLCASCACLPTSITSCESWLATSITVISAPPSFNTLHTFPFDFRSP